MIKELNLFQEVFLYNDPDNCINVLNKKYIIYGSNIRPHNIILDLRDCQLARVCVDAPSNCKLLLDSTTKLLEESTNKFDSAIYIEVDKPNEIQIDSLPENKIFLFTTYDSYNPYNPHCAIKFKINKNITNFKDFLENQEYDTLSAKDVVIDLILKNVERL